MARKRRQPRAAERAEAPVDEHFGERYGVTRDEFRCVVLQVWARREHAFEMRGYLRGRHAWTLTEVLAALDSAGLGDQARGVLVGAIPNRGGSNRMTDHDAKDPWGLAALDGGRYNVTFTDTEGHEHTHEATVSMARSGRPHMGSHRTIGTVTVEGFNEARSPSGDYKEVIGRTPDGEEVYRRVVTNRNVREAVDEALDACEHGGE